MSWSRSSARFADRRDAGRQLGRRLESLALETPVVLALPRGGVPVAFEVARQLGTPLDVLLVRKLGVPNQPEFAMGAIGEDDVRVVNDAAVRVARVTPDAFARVEAAERAELSRQARRYRAGDERIDEQIDLHGRDVVLVDDGIATGASIRAACAVVRARGAGRVVVAAPIAPHDVVSGLRSDADEVVVVAAPGDFGSVGAFYEDFTQTTDEEVIRLLAAARQPPADPRGRPAAGDR